jgi:PAS domain S-box-containing protein
MIAAPSHSFVGGQEEIAALADLRGSESRSQAAILTALPGHTALLNGRGEIIAVSEAWRRFGEANGLMTPAHCIGANYLELCDHATGAGADDAKQAAQGIRAVLGGQQNYSMEYTCHAPGEQRWFKLRVLHLDVAAGGVVVLHTDVTQGKLAADAIAELALQTERRERMLNIMLASTTHLAYILDRETRLLFVNKPLLELWGLPLSRVVGRNFYQLDLPAELAGKLQAQARQVFASPAVVTDEMSHVGPDGITSHFEYSFSPALAADGSVDFVVGSAWDVTARVQAENKLREREAEYRTLAEAMPQIVWITEPKTGCNYVNQHWVDYTGMDRQATMGSRWWNAFHPEDCLRMKMAGRAVAASRQPYTVKTRIRAGNGTYRWWLTRGVAQRDAEGQVLKWIGTCTDIDDLMLAEQELEARVRSRTAELNLAREEAEEASRAKSDFLATMSHEIRTPMSGLLGMLELLELSPLDPEQQSTLAVARDSGKALLGIIDDVLDFSKIEAHRLELNPIAASVDNVVQNICRLNSRIASCKNLTIHCDVAPEISPLLSFDPLRLGQILNNFFNNAIKFTERGGVRILVELVAAAHGMERLRFIIRDTGIGMTPDQLGRIFQPFVQAGPETAARFGGTGLGLVISRRLADLMGGTVDIRSSPGEGTELTLTVAFEVCESEVGRQPGRDGPGETLAAVMKGRRSSPPVAQAEAEGTLLLVVDDHPTNRMVLMRQVASLGYAAEEAMDGVEALAAWRSRRFGAVITDCNMPLMNGYELATAIRELEQTGGIGRIPIIACTANALPAAAAFCIGNGMDDCLVKPVTLADLSRKLDRWLPLARAGQRDAQPQVRPDDARAAPVPTDGLLDLVLLAELSGGDADMQGQILGDFRQVNESDATRLRAAAAVSDFPKVMAFSHRVRGCSLMLGATLLAGACGRLETAGAAADGPGVFAGMDNFETEFFRLNRYLDSFAPAQRAGGAGP